jgi:hypothetical protein
MSTRGSSAHPTSSVGQTFAPLSRGKISYLLWISICYYSSTYKTSSLFGSLNGVSSHVCRYLRKACRDTWQLRVRQNIFMISMEAETLLQSVLIMKKITGALVAAFCVYVMYSFITLDSDFGWHLANGRFIVKHGIPKTYPFSYTMPSYPFINHEWLADVLVASLYPFIGLAGLSILFALLAVTALAIQIAAVPSTIRRFLFIPLLLSALTLVTFLGIRMQIISWVFFSLLLWILTNPHYHKWRLLLPSLFLLWVNLHGGFAIGLLVVSIFLLGKVVTKQAVQRSDMVILLACFVAICINPYGMSIWSVIWKHASNSLIYLAIEEWRPLWFSPSLFCLWLFLTLSVNLFIRYWKKFSPLKVVLYITTLVLSLSSVRHLPFWLLRDAKRLKYPGKCDILQTSTVWRESMELTDELKSLLIDTAKQLKGSARRLFLARTVKALGPGGASRAERELGWNRKTIRKGIHEVESGITCLDAFGARGRKLAEEHLPNLLGDIRAIVDGQSQTDPQFKTNRLYTRLTATEVRRQLIVQKGYREEELPTATTIATKLNQLGYYPTKVAKSKPKKSFRPPMRSSSS